MSYIITKNGDTLVFCRECNVLLVHNGTPTNVYDQLVLEMETPEGAVSKHELLICYVCRKEMLMNGIANDALNRMYQDDIAQMVDSHLAVRGVLTDELKQQVDWLRQHVVRQMLNEEGTSVAALKAKGIL